MSKKELVLFEGKNIRKAWDAEQEEWYFSVVDVCGALSGSPNPRNYWNMLKAKLKDEGSEVYRDCVQLKIRASDGKMRETDVLDAKGVLRLIQSIPLPKIDSEFVAYQHGQQEDSKV